MMSIVDTNCAFCSVSRRDVAGGGGGHVEGEGLRFGNLRSVRLLVFVISY